MARPVRKAVFPVGGLGTRFLPATKAMPKEMLPVVDKPLIQYAVEEARAAGIDEFIFVTGRGKAAIEDHFDRSYELEDMLLARKRDDLLAAIKEWMPDAGQVAYTRQMEPLGLGHAVACARNLVGDEPFVVMLADDLILGPEPCLKQMMAAHRVHGGNMLAVMDVPREHTRRYGVVAPGRADGRVVEVRGLVEKPEPAKAPSTLSVIGRYILQPEVFVELEQIAAGPGGELQLTDALARLVSRQPFHGYRFAGERFDCGDKVGYLQANIAFALAREEIRAEFAPYLRALGKKL